MRTSIAITLACSLAAASSCNKDGSGTTNPDSADEDDLLGVDAGAKPREDTGEAVPVSCIQDPSDPDCAEVLGLERTEAGEIDFAGDTCRKNLCHSQGDCDLDADGFVTCICDENAGGEDCKKRRKQR